MSLGISVSLIHVFPNLIQAINLGSRDIRKCLYHFCLIPYLGRRMVRRAPIVIYYLLPVNRRRRAPRRSTILHPSNASHRPTTPTPRHTPAPPHHNRFRTPITPPSGRDIDIRMVPTMMVMALAERRVGEDDVPGMQDAGNPAEDAEEDVD